MIADRLVRLAAWLRLPVSRRRHEALWQVNEDNMAVARQTEEQLRKAREHAELEQPSRSGSPCRFEDAIRAHLESFDGDSTDPRNTRLWAVLDAHERQEGGNEPVTYQAGRRYRLVQDGERSFRAVPDWEHLQGGWP